MTSVEGVASLVEALRPFAAAAETKSLKWDGEKHVEEHRPDEAMFPSFSITWGDIRRAATAFAALAQMQAVGERAGLVRQLVTALEAAKVWLFLDDGSPYADEETRELVNDALVAAESQP